VQVKDIVGWQITISRMIRWRWEWSGSQGAAIIWSAVGGPRCGRSTADGLCYGRWRRSFSALARCSHSRLRTDGDAVRVSAIYAVITLAGRRSFLQPRACPRRELVRDSIYSNAITWRARQCSAA